MLSRLARHSSSIAAALWLAGVATGHAQSLPDQSPFLPPASVAAKAQAPAGYDLVGMTVVGEDTLLSILRQSDRRSVWIPVGRTIGEITVVSYDARTDEAVIRADGRMITLAMRKAAVVPGMFTAAPSLPPAPIALVPSASANPAPVAVPTKPMTVQEEKEMEARMLVTDLLEIGQQQRKAYEEAQRQAAARAAAAKGAPAPGAAPKR